MWKNDSDLKDCNRAMNDAVRQCLVSLGHESIADLRLDAVGGGCISDAMCVRWKDDQGGKHELFAKRNAAAFEDNFRCEYDGLQRLSESNTIRVPEPAGVFVVDQSAWLLTQWIEPGKRTGDFYTHFGRDVARLHKATRGDRIGLDRDNYLGSAKQPNASQGDWLGFVADARLGFQLRWAVDQGLAEKRLQDDVERVIVRLAEILAGRDPYTSLLHGDLWSGNYLCDHEGHAVILDPAVYYGCPEAEWGMIRLFGGCPSEFADAYHAEYPLADGWQRRSGVYVLYHLLNHLNLFGRSYASQCQSTVAELLRG